MPNVGGWVGLTLDVRLCSHVRIRVSVRIRIRVRMPAAGTCTGTGLPNVGC